MFRLSYKIYCQMMTFVESKIACIVRIEETLEKRELFRIVVVR